MSCQRKVFYYNDDFTKPIMAGGIILYKVVDNKIFLLLNDKEGMYEDLGGRNDLTDESIFDVVAREAHEESNYILDKNSLKERAQIAYHIYLPHAKYVVFIIRANENEYCLKSEIFGNKEIHDNIYRKVRWISLDNFTNRKVIKYKVSARLKDCAFFNMLKNIEKDIIEWQNFGKIFMAN